MIDRLIQKFASSDKKNQLQTHEDRDTVLDANKRWLFQHIFPGIDINSPEMVTPSSPQSAELSRRSFLTGSLNSTLLFFLHSLNFEFSAEESKEISSPTVEAYRDDVFLRLKSTYPSFEEAVLESNKRTELFFDHISPSPYALEGFYTLFGKASVAQGQLIAASNELREHIELGKLAKENLTKEQSRILTIRDIYDSENIEQQPIGSPKYNRDFLRILQEYRDDECQNGFIGIIATKSPKDLGRVGYMSIWDPVAEKWSPKGMVVVLNSATQKTFLGLKHRRVRFLNTDSFVGWGTEICEEVVLSSGLSETWTKNLSGFFRFSDASVFPRENTVVYPEYSQSNSELGTGISKVSDKMKQLISADYFHESVKNLIREVSDFLAQNTTTFDFTTQVNKKDYHFRQNFSGSTFVAYVLYQLGIPIFRDVTVKDVKDMLADTTNSATEAGFPLGEYSQRLVFDALEKDKRWEKRILCRSNTEISSNFSSGIFFLEDVLPSLDQYNYSVQTTGFIFKQREQFICYFLDRNNDFQKIPLSQYFESLHNGDRRIVIFS